MAHSFLCGRLVGEASSSWDCPLCPSLTPTAPPPCPALRPATFPGARWLPCSAVPSGSAPPACPGGPPDPALAPAGASGRLAAPAASLTAAPGAWLPPPGRTSAVCAAPARGEAGWGRGSMSALQPGQAFDHRPPERMHVGQSPLPGAVWLRGRPYSNTCQPQGFHTPVGTGYSSGGCPPLPAAASAQ